LTPDPLKDYLLKIQANKEGYNLRLAAPEVILAQEVFERLRQATAGDPPVLVELCRDYVTEARSTIEKLRQSLADGDAAEVRERAHYLKGSSMMIGARSLSQCCAALEQMGRDSDLEAAEPALDRIAVALRAVEEELMKRLGSMAFPAYESTSS
jgi:HPt (histidine-containing phosphotransfer) domain-containing protein